MNLLNSLFADALGKELDNLKKDILNLYLEDSETEEIGDRIYITNRKQGIGFVFDKLKVLIAIHFHSGIKEDYNRFTGALPHCVFFIGQYRFCS